MCQSGLMIGPDLHVARRNQAGLVQPRRQVGLSRYNQVGLNQVNLPTPNQAGLVQPRDQVNLPMLCTIDQWYIAPLLASKF